MISPDTLVEQLDKLNERDNGTSYEAFHAILIKVESAEYITLAVGVFLMLVGFLGCCGAGKESSWMIKLFIAIVVLLILGQFKTNGNIGTCSINGKDGLKFERSTLKVLLNS